MTMFVTNPVLILGLEVGWRLFSHVHWVKNKGTKFPCDSGRINQCYIADEQQNAGVQEMTLYLLYILQAARVWFQGGGVLHHFVHRDDQEDEIELSKQSNGSVNTWKYTTQDTQEREREGGIKKKQLLICVKSIKRVGAFSSLHVLIQ